MNSAQLDTSMLMSILNQVGANPSQTTQQTAPAAQHAQQAAQPNSNVAALMQQHGVKLINPISGGPMSKQGAVQGDPRQPGSDHRQQQQTRATMETPQLAGEGGLDMSNQMMSLLQRFTG